MTGQSRQFNNNPSHVCPRCGEWWEVESGGHDTWFVSVYESEGELAAKVWTEVACLPICPIDATTLHGFNIFG